MCLSSTSTASSNIYYYHHYHRYEYCSHIIMIIMCMITFDGGKCGTFFLSNTPVTSNKCHWYVFNIRYYTHFNGKSNHRFYIPVTPAFFSYLFIRSKRPSDSHISKSSLFLSRVSLPSIYYFLWHSIHCWHFIHTSAQAQHHITWMRRATHIPEILFNSDRHAHVRMCVFTLLLFIQIGII